MPQHANFGYAKVIQRSGIEEKMIFLAASVHFYVCKLQILYTDFTHKLIFQETAWRERKMKPAAFLKK